MDQDALENIRTRFIERITAELKEQGKVIFVVGAGISIGATKKGSVASWVNLVEHGIRECELLLGSSLEDGWAKRRLEDARSNSASTLILTAEDLVQRMKGIRDGEYGRWLAETVGSLQAERTETLDALAGLPITLATTNYDGILEEATHLPAVTWKQTAELSRVVRGESRGILHLHGHWKDPDSVVFGLRTYDELIRHEHAQVILRVLFSMKTLVFVGCGGGFHDPNFDSIRKWMAKALAQTQHHHYRLVLDEEVNKCQGEHGSDGIRVVPFGRTYDELPSFLRLLVRTPHIEPRSQASSHCIVHTDKTSEGIFEEILPFHRYSMEFDEADISPEECPGVYAVLHCPASRYLKQPLHIQRFTSVAALCITSPKRFISALERHLSPHGSSLFSRSPADMRQADRETIARAISKSLVSGFAISVAIPKPLLELTNENIKLSYQTILRVLLLPLLNVHRRQGADCVHVRIGQSGERDKNLLQIAKAAVSATFKRKGTANFAGSKEEPWSETLAQVARFTAWCVGRHYNHSDGNMLSILSGTRT